MKRRVCLRWNWCLKKFYDSNYLPLLIMKRAGGSDEGGQANKKAKGDHVDVLSEAPREIRLLDFVKSRTQEIIALEKCVSDRRKTKNATQLVPKHMRRRAASHNVRRLPRRIRILAAKHYENQDKKVPTKRPSRKYRRRPKNLLAEYNRRQRKNIWLGTHIWHAKRFHMSTKWGYRLPMKPCDKGQRAAYRSSAKHCLLQDTSYYCCIELSGSQDQILQGFSHLTSHETGLSIGSKMFVSGQREGSAILYAKNAYPFSAIGEISFQWKPDSQLSPTDINSSRDQCLWIWCHPACFEVLWKQLLNVFDMDNSNGIETVQDKSLKSNKVKIVSLKDSLVRYRLTGPCSTTVLSQTLHTADVSSVSNTGDPLKWWQEYYGHEQNAEIIVKQGKLWDRIRTVQSPAELAAHSILALTVRDPRLFLPKKRTKAENFTGGQLSGEQYTGVATEDEVVSPIWSSSIRKNVKGTKLNEQELNDLRSKNLVPGTPLNLGDDESRIPIHLIQRPGIRPGSRGRSGSGVSCPGYGSGWDIIIPSGWSMAFWIPLVYHGARVGGLREEASTASEQGVHHFPDNFPDSLSGAAELLSVKTELRNKYSRYPPAKRPNYIKLGVQHPFHCPWKELVKDWAAKLPDDKLTKLVFNSKELNRDSEIVRKSADDSTSERDCNQNPISNEREMFYVLRSRKHLKILDKLFNEVNTGKQDSSKHCGNKRVQVGKLKSLSSPNIDETLLQEHSRALVPVILRMQDKGVLSPNAMIHIPSKIDCMKGNKESDLQEPLHKDLTKSKHKKPKKKGKKRPKDCQVEDKGPVTLAGLNADEDIQNVVDANSRRIIGYVSQGGYSFAQGCSTGLGFCSLVGLLQYFKEHKDLEAEWVLVRQTTSLKYRRAYMSIHM